jgi:hypothetical protein
MGKEPGQHTSVLFLISAIGKRNKHQWIDQLFRNDKMLQLMMTLLRTLTPMAEIKTSHRVSRLCQFMFQKHVQVNNKLAGWESTIRSIPTPNERTTRKTNASAKDETLYKLT